MAIAAPCTYRHATRTPPQVRHVDSLWVICANVYYSYQIFPEGFGLPQQPPTRNNYNANNVDQHHGRLPHHLIPSSQLPSFRDSFIEQQPSRTPPNVQQQQQQHYIQPSTFPGQPRNAPFQHGLPRNDNHAVYHSAVVHRQPLRGSPANNVPSIHDYAPLSPPSTQQPLPHSSRQPPSELASSTTPNRSNKRAADQEDLPLPAAKLKKVSPKATKEDKGILDPASRKRWSIDERNILFEALLGTEPASDELFKLLQSNVSGAFTKVSE